jgi:oxygen-independent coproporphyrinogen-3 oxidase
LRKKYIGIGPSAHSYNGLYRSWNISNNKKYIDQIQSGKLFYKKEILSKVDQYNEYIMTGLRTMWGISINFIENKFGKNFKNHFLKSIKKYIDQKLIHISNDMYITTDSARFLADGIAADLFIIDLSE